jgi:mutual gliding-motility protein MglA
VFVADSQWDKMAENVDSWENLKENLDLQKAKMTDLPHVLQYNKRDLPTAAPMEYLEYLLNNGEVKIPAFPGVAVTGEGVIETLNAIAKLVVNDFIKKHNP